MNLCQVTLPCFDYDESVAFYSDMGFTLIVASPTRYARFECESGATFSLHIHDQDEAAIGAVVVYFETDDLDDKVAELKALGFKFEVEPTDQPWLWREAYLRDPAGNRICLFQAGENRRNPPWRVS